MAKLTETLNAVNSGKPIVDPGPANPSFMGALANFGSGVVETVGQGLAMRDRLNANAEREDAQRRQQAQESALDELVGGVHNARREAASGALNPEAPMPQWSGAVDSNTMLPGGVMSQANEVLRVRRAVEQGRASQGTLDMRIENLVTNLFQQHPDSRYEIAVAMKGLGIDHYLFREEAGRRSWETAEEETQTRAFQSQYNVAAEAGIITGETSLEQGAAAGRQLLERRAAIEAAKSERERMVQDRTMRLEDLDRETERLSGEVVNNLIAEYGAVIGPRLEMAQLAIAGAGTDAERQAALGEVRITARASLEAAKARALVDIAATGNSADARKQVTDFFDGQISSLDALFDTSFEQNSAAAKSLSAGLNIDMARALPVYGRISAALGPAGANALINDLTTGAPGIDPAMLEAARAEIRNFDPTSPRGTMSLARAIGYLRGDTRLEDLTAEEAPSYIRMNAAALRANQTEVLRGNTGALRPWQVAYGNTVEATLELAPTTASSESLWRATQLFATNEARRALDIAVQEDPEYGEALANASRNAAAHTLNIARRPQPSDGPFIIDYNTASRTFRPVLTRQAYDAWVREQNEIQRAGRGAAGAMAGGMLPGNLGAVPSFEEMRRRIPESVNQRLTAMNNSLAHLVLTDKYDEAIPRSVTGAERQRLYAEGATPASMAQAGRSPTQADEFERLRSSALGGFQELLTDTARAPRAENTNFREALIQSESGGDATEVNDEGYGGRMQFGAERLADAAGAGLVPPGTTGADFAQMSEAQQARVEDWHFRDIDSQAEEMGLTRYHGQTVAGVPINENSIRAMAHLGGINGARRFIESGGQYNPADSNGTKLSDYGRRFGRTG